MKFWDSSGLVPLFVDEASTGAMSEQVEADPSIVIWWGTPVECVSALARRARLGATEAEIAQSVRRLEDLMNGCVEIQPGDRLRSLAERLVRVHDLRAADGFQLAAAFVAADERPETLELVTLDERLATAAALEGFRVLGG